MHARIVSPDIEPLFLATKSVPPENALSTGTLVPINREARLI